MKRLLLDLPYFIEVARNKSFTRAAEILDVPVSTLSRRITLLEQDLGIQLLHRSTRKIELTDAGQQLYVKGYTLLGSLEDLQEELKTDLLNPKGKIRVVMQTDTYYLFLQGAFCSFTRQYPEIEMHAYLAERWWDPGTDPIDLSIRGGEMPDSELIRRKLVTIFPAIYASPKLLEIFPEPKEPGDLAKIPFIFHVAEGRNTIELQKQDAVEKLAINPTHVVNGIGLSLEFALDGQGAAVLVPSVAKEHIEQGRLVQLLPEWAARGIDVSVVMAPGTIPFRVRLFVDHLVRYLTA